MLFLDPVIMKMTIIDHVQPLLQRREDFLKNKKNFKGKVVQDWNGWNGDQRCFYRIYVGR